MVLARWAPFAEAQDDFNQLVRRAFGDFGSSLAGSRNWAPALDAFVEGEELHVRVEIPGIDPDADVDIEVDNGVLTISGERKQEKKHEGEGWFRSEMSYGRFERRIGLPEGADTEQVRATYDKGILEVIVPTPAKQKTKIKVEVGNAHHTRELKG
jgi:HSP20 family protein